VNFWAAEARFDWGDYVRSHGGMRALRGRADEYLMACPSCGKPKLAVNVTRRAWRCFVCGEGGRDAASLIAKIEGLRFGEAMLQVMSGHRAAVGRIDVIEQTLEESKDPRRLGWIPKQIPFPQGFGWLIPFWPARSPVHRQAIDYAISRQWPEYAVDGMKLGICTMGRYRGRIIFPVFDPGGRIIFYQGRATWTPDPRERHIKTLSPKRESDEHAGPADCLLNLDYVEAQGFDHVLAVEGPTDAIKAWPDVVATFGKNFSARQMELLVRAGVKYLDICWDNDIISPEQRARGVISGYEAAIKVAPQLADLFEVRVVCLPQGMDPGVLTKDEIERYRSQAQRWGRGDRLSTLPDTL